MIDRSHYLLLLLSFINHWSDVAVISSSSLVCAILLHSSLRPTTMTRFSLSHLTREFGMPNPSGIGERIGDLLHNYYKTSN